MIIIQPKGQNTILPRMESGLHLSLMEKYALFLKAGKKKKKATAMKGQSGQNLLYRLAQALLSNCLSN